MVPGGSKSSGRPSMALKIENFTDDQITRVEPPSLRLELAVPREIERNLPLRNRTAGIEHSAANAGRSLEAAVQFSLTNDLATVFVVQLLTFDSTRGTIEIAIQSSSSHSSLPAPTPRAGLLLRCCGVWRCSRAACRSLEERESRAAGSRPILSLNSLMSMNSSA